MILMPMDCLPEELMRRYITGSATESERFEADCHLAGCDRCVERLRAMAYLRQNFDTIWGGWSEAEHQRLAR